MRTQFLFVVILGIYSYNHAQSQSSSFQCFSGDTYPYFVNTHDPNEPVKRICSLTPNAERDILKLKLPLKICLPTALTLFDIPLSSTNKAYCNTNGRRFIDNLRDALNNVLEKWIGICFPDPIQKFSILDPDEWGQCETGSVAILQTNNPKFFTNEPGVAIENVFAHTRIPGTLNADGTPIVPVINLNVTEDFMTKGGINKNGNIFSFEPCSQYNHVPLCSEDESKETKQCIDVESVLMHEIGHLFGLAHTFSDEGKVGCNNHGSFDDIMYNYGSKDPKRELTDRDKCAFQRLYCPEMTGIATKSQFEIDDYKLYIYPNPIISKVSHLVEVRYFVPQSVNITLSIVNINGEAIWWKQIFVVQSGWNAEIIYPSEFSPGVYFICLATKNIKFSKTIVIL